MAKITLKPGALRALLMTAQIQAELTRRANNIAAAADARANDPGGHKVYSGDGRVFPRAAVVTDTPKAMYKEATVRSLTSSIDAGRG